jgi:hypothetical protein
VVEVKGTLDELYELFGKEAKKELRRQTKKAAKKTVRSGARKVSAYQKKVGKHMKALKKKHPRMKQGAIMKKAHKLAKRK